MSLLGKIQGALFEAPAKPPEPAGQPDIADLDQRDEYLTAICEDLTDGPMHTRLAEQMNLGPATRMAIVKVVCKMTDEELVAKYGGRKVELKSAGEHKGTYQKK